MGELFDRLLLLLREQGVQGLIASALPELTDTAAVRPCRCGPSRPCRSQITPEETDLLNQLTRKCHRRRTKPAWLSSTEALNRDMLDS